MVEEVRRFKQKKLDELREAQAHKNDSPAAKEVWKKAIADIKEIDVALRGGANTLEEVKLALINNTSLISEIDIELERKKEEAVREEAKPVDKSTSGSEVFSARLEALISAVLQDGVFTEQEKAIIKRHVEKEGEDWDEVEMIISARLAEIQNELKPTTPITATDIQQTSQDASSVSEVEVSPKKNEVLINNYGG